MLFTDVEGSTRLLHELGDDYAGALADHRRILRDALRRHGGVEVDAQGDAFFFAFERAAEALAAAAEAREALESGPIRTDRSSSRRRPESSSAATGRASSASIG